MLDTRKTTPGLRLLEKYAVRAGGGANKRMGLYDVAMVKDNHKLAAGGVAAAYRLVRAALPRRAGPGRGDHGGRGGRGGRGRSHFLLCDNMSPELLREVVAAVGGRAELEATGGLTLAVAARVRRDRRGLPLGRGADPLLADPGHRARPPPARLGCRRAALHRHREHQHGPRHLRGRELVHSWRIKTDAQATADELGLVYRGLLAADAVEVTGVCACSTVPAALRALRVMLARYYPDVPSLIVEPGCGPGCSSPSTTPRRSARTGW